MHDWRECLKRTRANNGISVGMLKSGPASFASPVTVAPKTIDRGSMSVTCVLTTPDRDRQGDIVEPLGCDTGDHESNPIVMFHHGRDHKLPIGKAEDPNGNYTVKLIHGPDNTPRLVGTTYFSQSSPFASDVFGLVAEDILRGVSVGFDPIDEGPRSHVVEEIGDSPTLDRPALRFKSWKLLEYSHTPLGVNREALTVAVHKSHDGSRVIHPKLLKFLEPYASPRRVTVAGGWQPARVEKSMPMDDDNYDDADPTAGGADPTEADPAAAPAPDAQDAGGEELTPAVKTCYDGAQSLLDLCDHLDASMKKSEHKDAKKKMAKLCAELKQEAQELKEYGDEIKAELAGDTDDAEASAEGSDDDAEGEEGDDEEGAVGPEGEESDDAAEGDDAEGGDDEEEDDDKKDKTPPAFQKDRTGALVIKGYSPKRWTFADLAGDANKSTTTNQPTRVAKDTADLATRLKALEQSNAEKDRELNAVRKEFKGLMADLQAANRRSRR